MADLIVRGMVWVSALDDKLTELGRPLTAYVTACGAALRIIGAALRDQHDQLVDAILGDPSEPPEAKRYAEILAIWVDGQTDCELSAPRYGMADYLS